MARCEYAENCRFLNELHPSMAAIVKLYKRLYCMDNAKGCARYVLGQSLGSDFVPPDLFPHQRNRAEKLLAQNNAVHAYH